MYRDYDRAQHLIKVWVVGCNIHIDRVEYISEFGKRRCYSDRVPDGKGGMVKKPDPHTTIKGSHIHMLKRTEISCQGIVISVCIYRLLRGG
ncbi:hypothetical protein FKM82_006088 [Ascaphus truei]